MRGRDDNAGPAHPGNERETGSKMMKLFWPAFAGLLLCSTVAADPSGTGGGSRVLDFNEQTHLVFMCEEEKLARDVYRLLGRQFPELGVFTDMEASKEHSRCEVEELLRKYRVSVARVNDNVGVFSWGIYGRYFMEKFLALSSQGSISPLNALYVGAFIEELNILDIRQCPKVIIDVKNGINDAGSCGSGYTDNPDVRRAYEVLLEESRRHLRTFVRAIEQYPGAEGYQAQVLQQDELNTILSGR